MHRHAHACTYFHMTHTWMHICSHSYIHAHIPSMHTPFTHEYPYAHTAHIYLHALYMHAYVHTRPQNTLHPTACKAQAHHGWDSTACTVTGLWNVPWDLGMRCHQGRLTVAPTSPARKQHACPHSFPAGPCASAKGLGGGSGAQPGPRWQSSPKQGHFLRLSKRALSFLPNI